MKKLLLLLFSFFYSLFSFSQQAPGIEWQNTIGGSGWEELYAIEQTSDAGYIIGGYSLSNISGDKTESSQGGSDYWIVKTDPLGNIQWQNTIGGSSYDELYSMQQTSDGGYILGGYSWSNISGDKTENCYGWEDYWLVKTDAAGAIQWQITLGGDSVDYLYALQQTSDGGYIVGGSSESNISGNKTENRIGGSDFWIVKTDALGNILWQNTIGGSGNDDLVALDQTDDGGYILGGYSSSDISGDKMEDSNGLGDYWIVKTDSLGDIQWQNSIGGSEGEYIHGIQPTYDGGYIIGGYSFSNISGDKTENNNGGYDYWIVKTDEFGNIQWQNTIGGSGHDELYSIRQKSDSGYILAGSSLSNISGDKDENSNGTWDYWIVSLDTTGNITWQSTIGGNNIDHLYCIEQTSDSGYILGGWSTSSISGDKTENSNGVTDYWIIKLDADSVLTELHEIAFSSRSLSIYPNPANDQLNISTDHFEISKLQIANTLGQIVLSQNLTTHYSLPTTQIDVSTLPAGVYLLTAFINQQQVTKMFVKQ